MHMILHISNGCKLIYRPQKPKGKNENFTTHYTYYCVSMNQCKTLDLKPRNVHIIYLA